MKEWSKIDVRPTKWAERACTSAYHNPPTHLYIPPGQTYTHVCPGCGTTQTIISGSPIM